MEREPNQESRENILPLQNEIVKVKRFKTQFDPTYTGAAGEINTLPSLTVPDMSLTIQQLLLNHTRGIGSDVAQREGAYFEDTEIPVFHDLTDMVAYKEEMLRQLEEVERVMKQEKAEKEKEREAFKATAKPANEVFPDKGRQTSILDEDQSKTS